MISGKEFNQKGIQLYKLTREDNNHNGLQFKEGLNKDILPWNISESCSKGGIYTTPIDCFYKWLFYSEMSMYWRWKVTIPDEAKVFIEDNQKVKVDQLILSECIPICEMKEWEDLNIQLEAVEENGYAIQFISNPSEQVQLEAVKQNGYAIYNIKNPSEQVQLEAVKQNGCAIAYIKTPSEQIQLEAVKQNGYAIQFIENHSEQIQLEAVKQNDDVIYYIKNL